MTKIEQALEYIKQGMSKHAAAKKAELAPAHVYMHFKKERDKAHGICPCCGRPLGDRP